ncbi:uncharacterized protein EI97DRAFT_423203 [Westerdykella ornata]|uniref:Checkpoint protein kinase-like protein n=1 Tax=Westerdykella ornata TaxID=318751 RepID=A0A6A6JD34_WESOR|nr:uncharacterized protein EI97DRAFT_423203 [Westerdykella ornata]KAF2273908.1 hypothetical protein EI97DRAFT_423203 [Westerdykella ornata]
MGSGDLVDFEIIENQKENIQALPSGRSAKALAQLYTPPLSSGGAKALSPLQVQDSHNTARQEFEKELQTIDESDDPLDIYDRYVKWTLDTYPSAQNTPQSQLCPLLERATKAFQSSSLYKNDPRYLKLWLHYIRFFSDAPKETFAYLARHNIGEGLALYYEEFAAWLETAGRWKQAEEIYALGIEREARPVERLIRKYGEFQHRYESRPHDAPEPSSPALPTLRPALAAKVDAFGPAPAETQTQNRGGLGTATTRSGKPKLAIFSDAEEPAKAASAGTPRGWDSIGTLADRKKENKMEARPWAGETLQVGKKNTGVQKMMVFKDGTESKCHNGNSNSHPMREYQQAINPRTGRLEVVFADLRLVYPDFEDPMAMEYSFEELRAKHRGWADYDWAKTRREKQHLNKKLTRATELTIQSENKAELLVSKERIERPHKPQTIPLKGSVEDDAENDENTPPSQAEVEKARVAKKARREERANRTRKIKVMDVREIHAETQTIQANLDSPTSRRIRRKKNGAEPTMTLHTKEAMDDIYEIFNQPLKKPEEGTVESESEVSSDDDDYTSAGESTGTGRISGTNSEFGDETTAGDFTLRTTIDEDEEDETTDGDQTDVKSVSEWSEFTESKHVPKEHRIVNEGDDTAHSDENFSEHVSDSEPQGRENDQEDDLVTPTSPAPRQGPLPSKFVPLPPEDCNIPTQPYRDAVQAANNRLPFMTPIVEKTESSLGIATIASQKEFISAKTPSRSKGAPVILEDDAELWSSPFQGILEQGVGAPGKVTQLVLREAAKKQEPASVPKPSAVLNKEPEPTATKSKGPIIKDAQCNPVDESIRELILSQIQPPLQTYDGYFDNTTVTHGKAAEIRRFTKALKAGKNAHDKTIPNLPAPPLIKFEGCERSYTVKRELGKGAFAPVYLVESHSAKEEAEDTERPPRMGKGEFGIKRRPLEAIKMEDPPSPWEFYIMRQARRRLGVSRAGDSIIDAYEMHMFKDECYLVEEYREQGTLLDLVNIARAENGVMDEQLAMFFTIELFRTVEALHTKGLIHGDLKSDNVLVRFDTLKPDQHWDSKYRRDGRNGWAAKGIVLIDFGRGIDMKVFKPDVQFIADWKTSEQDCAEMRELRPWTYQVDYHGLAGIVHNLLFGKYISTMVERGGTLGAGATKTYKIRESLKRYWQTDIWGEVFDLLLNPLMHLEGEEGRKLPILKGMKGVREKMETYLEENCEQKVGLKGLIRRMEDAVNTKRR